jgi:hypothetical protein
MPHHTKDPAATSLARGPAKCDDIEGVRRDLVQAERLVAERLHAAAFSQERDAASREEDDRRGRRP